MLHDDDALIVELVLVHVWVSLHKNRNMKKSLNLIGIIPIIIRIFDQILHTTNQNTLMAGLSPLQIAQNEDSENGNGDEWDNDGFVSHSNTRANTSMEMFIS